MNNQTPLFMYKVTFLANQALIYLELTLQDNLRKTSAFHWYRSLVIVFNFIGNILHDFARGDFAIREAMGSFKVLYF